MTVSKYMAVLSGTKGVTGVVKFERIGTALTGTVRLNKYDDAQYYLGVRINDLPVQKIEIIKNNQSFRLGDYDGNIMKIECVVVSMFDMSLVMQGGNSGKVDTESILKEFYSLDNMRIVGEEVVSEDEIVNAAEEANADKVSEDMEDGIDSEVMQEDVEAESIMNKIEDILQDGESLIVGKIDEEENVESENSEDGERGKETLYSKEHPFSRAIGVQLEDLFARYEREDELERLVVGSRFARVYYDDTNYYVVGEIKDGDEVAFICYGYKGEGGDNPPEEIKDNYEWLPLDKDDKKGKGYYIMYQDGVTGDVIEKS